MKYFYEKNRELLESDVNKKFEDILAMSKDEFRAWAIDLRKTVVYLWVPVFVVQTFLLLFFHLN